MCASYENHLIYGNEIARFKKNGRLKVPDEFRKTVFKNSRSHSLVLRIGSDHRCLEVSDLSSDRKQFFNARTYDNESSIEKMRYRVSTVADIGMDDRVSIPAFFRAQAQLDDHVIFLGTGDGFEIWNPALLLADEDYGKSFAELIKHYVSLGQLPREILKLPVSKTSVVPVQASEAVELESSEEVSEEVGVTENATHAEEVTGAEEQPQLAYDSNRQAREDETDATDETVPIDALTLQRRGKRLVYSSGLGTVMGRAKRVDYISPTLTLDNSQWVIVVHPQGLFSERCVRPMWRALAADQDGQPEDDAVFPTDWRDYSDWPGYDPENHETRGLPNELCEHFRRHKRQINEHLLEASKPRLRPIIATIGATISGENVSEDTVIEQSVN